MNRQVLLQQLRVISPLWTIKIGRKLRDHTSMKFKCFIKNTNLDLTQYHSCIVGEAFLFDDLDRNRSLFLPNKYHCKKCTTFASRLDRPLPDKYFFMSLIEFIKHFKDKHAERYIKKLEIAIKVKEDAKNTLL